MPQREWREKVYEARAIGKEGGGRPEKREVDVLSN